MNGMIFLILWIRFRQTSSVAKTLKFENELNFHHFCSVCFSRVLNLSLWVFDSFLQFSILYLIDCLTFQVNSSCHKKVFFAFEENLSDFKSKCVNSKKYDKKLHENFGEFVLLRRIHSFLRISTKNRSDEKHHFRNSRIFASGWICSALKY